MSSVNARQTVLFVDENEAFLQELEAGLKAVRSLWNPVYQRSVVEAAKFVAATPPDVIVASLDMTGSNGLKLLRAVQNARPEAVRFGLVSDEGSEDARKAASVAHQLLHKPLDLHEYQVLINRAISLRERLRESPLKKKLHDVGGLPSLPSLYRQVMKEINSEDASVAAVGEIIQQDIGMSAKLLQIVNSAAIGLRHEVSNVVQAASLLGLQRVSSMLLMVEVFSTVVEKSLPRGFSVDALWSHSLAVAEMAKAIAAEEIDEEKIIDDSFTAGMLHDIGLVILASRLPEELSEALELARKNGLSLFDAEKKLFEGTHAEVGGYLLELWGLPDPIIEAITYHDFPSAVPEKDYPSAMPEHGFTPLTAVHVANYFCEDERKEAFGVLEGEADIVFLERLGFDARMEAWWDATH